MKSSYKRITSCLIAFVMLVSNIFTNLIVTNAKIDDTTSDEVVSGSAVATNYKWSADDLAEEIFTTNPELGGEIFDYSIISGKSKVTGNKKTFADGSSFEKRLQMGGTGKIDSNEGVFTINAPSAGLLYVYAVTGSNDEGRAVEFYSADNVLIDSDVSGLITDASTYTYPVFVYDIAEAGTYKITSTSGAVNFYGMAFKDGYYHFSIDNYDENATDVWDFSPTYVTGANNYITADNINKLFKDYSVGTTGVYFNKSFVAGDLKCNSEVSPTARLRTINSRVTRYDNDSQLSSITGFDYMENDITGCLYFNSYSGSSYKYFDIGLNAGDIVKIWLKFDNGDDSLHLYDGEGNQVDGYSDAIDGSTGGTVQTFAVNKSGTYSISSGSEGNPVGIYRITREKGSFTTVSGNVTMPQNMPEFKLVFTNTATGEKTECDVAEGSYTVELLTGYEYSVSMEGADGYLLSEGLSITAEGESATNDIVIKGRDIAIVSGVIEGLTADEVQEANIKFVPDEASDYVPELTIDGTNYSARLEKNVNYTVEYSVSKDIELENGRFNVTDDSVTENLRFVPKAKYKVNIESDWCSAEDLANAVFTFTDIEDSSYVYTFTGTDNIALRNGKYSVKVENTGVYKYDSIDDIEVNNSEAVLNIDFYSEWNFDNDDDWTGADFSGVADGEFKGLKFNLDTVKYHSVGATMRNGTISVPVRGMSGVLTVGLCYDYNITLPDGRNYSYRTGSISNVEEFKCNVNGSSEYVNIDVGNDKSTYICYIKYGKFIYKDPLESKLWKTTAPWYGTVFGDIGGNAKLYATDTEGNIIDDQLAVNTTTGNTNFAITENEDGSVTVRAGEVKTDDKNAAAYSYGKIASTSDGIAMYYRPVDAASNCTIKAKAHVNGVANTNNQTAFGAIIADEILVDENNKIMIENYVAASPLKMVANVGGTNAETGTPITAWGGYARINGTLTQGAEIATADGIPKAGDVIDVEITKVGNTYKVKYGDYESEFEVYMTGTMYVGLFAARCADITFTDIVYNNEVVEGGNTTTETTTEGVTESTTSAIDNLFGNSPAKDKKTAESNNGWNIVNDNGEFYAQSSNTADSSSSAISVTIEGPGVLYYEAAVSSEANGDELITICNNSKLPKLSGTNGYSLENPYVNCIVLNEGENVITWEYSKDSSGSAGQDCAWIKNLRVADIGDSNLDGKVDITDAVLGQKYAADSSAISDVLGQKVTDYNNDGTVDKTDTAYVLKEIIKSIA